MKVKMKEMVKRMAITVLAAAVLFGSAAPVPAEAKGTAFMKKKTSNVTPTIKSAKRSNGKITVTVSVPTSKAKKLGKVKKITVAYGTTKNSKKFEAKKLQVTKVTKKGKNQYTFTINNKKLASYKNAYMTVRFDGKSNWSKLVKVSGKATTSKKTNLPKKDKDGTYASAIHKRFNWDYKGCKITVCGVTLGTEDDGDGWINVFAQASRCDGCGKTSFCFVSENWHSRDCTVSCCNGNSWGTVVMISFDKKTGKVVNGSPVALERYPIGTFFMDVD